MHKYHAKQKFSTVMLIPDNKWLHLPPRKEVIYFVIDDFGWGQAIVIRSENDLYKVGEVIRCNHYSGYIDVVL